jgi:hypothetical protein
MDKTVNNTLSQVNSTLPNSTPESLPKTISKFIGEPSLNIKTALNINNNNVKGNVQQTSEIMEALDKSNPK